MKNRFPVVLGLIALFLFQNVSFAQDYIQGKGCKIEVVASPLMSRPQGVTIEEFVEVEEDGYILQMSAKKGAEPTFVKYGTDMQVIEGYQYQMDTDNLDAVRITTEKNKEKGHTSEGVVRLGDRFFHIQGTADKSEKANTVIATEYSEDSKKIGKPVVLGSIEGEGYYRDFKNAHLDWDVSVDGDQFMLYYKLAEEKDEQGHTAQRFLFKVFDTELDLLWEQLVNFKDPEGKTRLGGNTWFAGSDHGSVMFGDDGNIYCWSQTVRSKKFKGDLRFKANLFMINANGIKKESVVGAKSTTWFMHQTEAGIELIDTYGKKGYKFFFIGTNGGEEGFAFIDWRVKENEKPTFQQVPFGVKHLTTNQPQKVVNKMRRKAKAGKPLLSDKFTLRKVVELDGGERLLFGEISYIVTKTNSRTGYTRTTYHKNDIHVFYLNSVNDIEWSTIIPKRQANSGNVGLSFATKIWDNKLHVMFNDNFKNLKKDWKPYMKPHTFVTTSNPVSLVTIDMDKPNAKQYRQTLWRSKSAGGLFELEKFYTRPDLPFGLVYIQGGKLKQRLLRIDFDSAAE